MTGAAIETGITAVLSLPLCDLEPEAVLVYYQDRRSVKYFPVADADEVQRHKIDAILTDRFEFNGESHQLERGRLWLQNPSRDLEWLIQLHKFYYAVGLGIAYAETADEGYARKWVELTSTWIQSTPLDFLPSDVTGRRLRNWIHAHYYFVTLRRSPSVTAEFYLQFLVSLCEQAEYLRNHLSPARNHRTLELFPAQWDPKLGIHVT